MFHPLDIAILVVLLVGFWRGWRNGLSGELLRVAALVVAFVVANRCHALPARWIAEHTSMKGAAVPFLSYAVIFVGIWAVGWFVRTVVHKILTISFVKHLETIGGAFAGALKTAVILALALVGMTLVPLLQPLAETIAEHSTLAAFTVAKAPTVCTELNEIKKKYIPSEDRPEDEAAEPEPREEPAEDEDTIEPIEIPDEEIDLHPDRLPL